MLNLRLRLIVILSLVGGVLSCSKRGEVPGKYILQTYKLFVNTNLNHRLAKAPVFAIILICGKKIPRGQWCKLSTG